jgi:hypothetical protein
MAVRTMGIPAWMTYKRNLAVLPTYDIASRHYQYWHIPRPPVEDPAGSTPGLICWGAAGAMPSAEPLPTVDFNVKNEKKRISELIQIKNPDDPSQYVVADRAKEITFEGKTNKAPPKPNTATKPAPGMSDYSIPLQEKFVPAGGGAQSTGQETFVYKSTAP